MQTSSTISQTKSPYFNKGKRLFKLGLYCWLAAMLLAQLVKLLPDEGIFSAVGDILVAMPMLAEFIIVPLAIINLIKSFGHHEPPNKYRTFYLIVLICIALFLLLLLVAISGDVKAILTK